MSDIDGVISDKEKLMALFLNSGSISDPEKDYHMEFVCDSEDESSSIAAAMNSYGISPGITLRKEHYVVYLKDSEAIADMLKVLGAHNALLGFENVRVLKEMKETVQRRVNCETSNIRRTVSASVRQLEDIRLLKQSAAWEELPESLKATANLREAYPDATLSELAKRIPDVGKSGINHRLRRLSEIAGTLKEK